MKANTKTKIRITIASLTLCAASALATGAVGLMVADSEALAARINLWTLECDGGPNTTGTHNAAHEGKETCARQKRDIIKDLNTHVKFADEVAVDVEGDVLAAYRLEARAARYNAKCIGRYNAAECQAEHAAIQKETARLLAQKGGYENGWSIGTGLTKLERD